MEGNKSMSRKSMIDRLLSCRSPARFANYPRSWYEKRSTEQLIAMCSEIRTKIDEEEKTNSSLRYNAELGEYEVFTERGEWETAYN